MLTHDLVYWILEKLNLYNKKPVIIQWWGGGGEGRRGRGEGGGGRGGERAGTIEIDGQLTASEELSKEYYRALLGGWGIS